MNKEQGNLPVHVHVYINIFPLKKNKQREKDIVYIHVQLF